MEIHVIDRFNITGRGFVYLVNIPVNMKIRVNDCITDTEGNIFRVNGIDVGRKSLICKDDGYMLVGLSLENDEMSEVKGNILKL